jgi:predicted ATP-binding protein involved in virulence
MRVKEIKIEGLFDMFDHTIPLKMEERLSIIYGINGIGKTMIFKILDSLFNSASSFSASNISKYPFKRLIITYENGSILNVEIELKNKEIEIRFQKAEKIETITKRKENSSKTKSVLNTGDPKIKEFFTFMKDIQNQISVFFIETQRLIKFKSEKIGRKLIERIDGDSVSVYSSEIAEIINTKRKERDKLSNELQQSLHTRILSNDIQTDFTIEQLNKVSLKIEQRIEELKRVGLLEGIKMDNFKVTEDVDAVKRAILSVNIQDIQKTLAIYDDLYPKFEKFIEILNERRLSFKKIALSENGFIFTNSKGKILNANDLSSGEQHELVLLYLLLFKIPENSLVLIDEPEISLHITWQKAFLDDMKDIIKLRNFDIVVATHSPAIINGNWDLTIKLDGNGENE